MRERKIYWFTGQPGAGKTELALRLKEYLEQINNEDVFHIDGDNLRKLFMNINYGREGREENIKRAQDIAKFIYSQGYDVVVSLVAPYKELRDKFKEELKTGLVEIYVHTTNIRGRENYHTNEYSAPSENYIDIDTTDINPEESLTEILSKTNLIVNLPRESKTYQIRYNTISKDDTERWRLIENGNEILVSDVIVNGYTRTTKDWMSEINDYKWHVSCVGYCEVIDNVAHINS
jgi:adenylylsulfate kinase-like enzyme